MTHNHRGRKKAWCKHVLEVARSRGDKRPSTVILEEHIRRSEIIREAFKDAHRDKERAETVALNDYPDAGIFKAEVLTQARSYVHPKLLPT
jgi:hypothetical protein